MQYFSFTLLYGIGMMTPLLRQAPASCYSRSWLRLIVLDDGPHFETQRCGCEIILEVLCFYFPACLSCHLCCLCRNPARSLSAWHTEAKGFCVGLPGCRLPMLMLANSLGFPTNKYAELTPDGSQGVILQRRSNHLRRRAGRLRRGNEAVRGRHRICASNTALTQ